MSTSPPPASPPRAVAQGSARVAAVQALFQWEARPVPLPRLIAEFHQHRLGVAQDEVELAPPDRRLFEELVRGTLSRLEELDSLLAPLLAEGWTLERLDRPLRQLLRLGAHELTEGPDQPAAGPVISAWVDVAHAFYARREAGFVNAVLDRVARGPAAEASA